jgi:nucleoside-diphosphate-sugar epimerase
MNVLAIGGTGFIGKYVAVLLIEQGHRVAVVHRGSATVGIPTDVYHIVGNRDTLADLQDVTKFKPTVVLDVICYTELQAQELMNVFRGVAERVVALSSADVYRNYDGFRGKGTAPPDPVPLSEGAPLRETLYPYRGYGLPLDWADGYDKILVERIVMSDTDLPGTVLRLPAIYGPRDKQNRVGAYLEQMSTEQRVLMTREQAAWRWTRGYVEDVAAAIVLAVVDDRATDRIYNVGDESALPEREWVGEIGKAIGWTGEVLQASAEDLPEHHRQPFDFRYELMTDTKRIREELGYKELVGRKEGLRRTVEWERLRRPEEWQEGRAG